ncbi:hypothetical protein AB0J47_38760 [Nocardia sp. NPDC049737]|uniref:hypothetical protein n=1 Tax=Nocardia sp. NPDC049737 TaxID=3154358 RepID=UPI00342B4803
MPAILCRPGSPPDPRTQRSAAAAVQQPAGTEAGAVEVPLHHREHATDRVAAAGLGEYAVSSPKITVAVQYNSVSSYADGQIFGQHNEASEHNPSNGKFRAISATGHSSD